MAALPYWSIIRTAARYAFSLCSNRRNATLFTPSRNKGVYFFCFVDKYSLAITQLRISYAMKFSRGVRRRIYWTARPSVSLLSRWQSSFPAPCLMNLSRRSTKSSSFLHNRKGTEVFPTIWMGRKLRCLFSFLRL